ncbi:redox-regulated ATPase YchF [Candidatus Daviesbacteria bacterium]|nr:redox-regulated ATPase YchF [Candidatus Daviesbacteria bacterium]
MSVGIVGLPNVGKSTLFNALLKKRVALSANYPFATIEPNTGVVAVPDERLGKLAELTKAEEKMESLPPIMPAVVEFVDIAGLVKGASTGAGLGNQFLSHIREVDAIIHVLRDFEDPSTSSGQVPIIREGSTDPKSDREIVETELALADLQVIEKLVSAAEKEIRGSKDSLDPQKLEILKNIKAELEQGRIIGKFNVGDERLKGWFNSLPLLTIKPALHVFNVDEGSYAHRLEHEVANENEMVISAKIEEELSELSELSEEERGEYLKELGISEPGLNRLIKKAYSLLGLISFLTAGKKEVRAWTIKKGTKAPQAAGVIHTDFEKGFIRSQVIEYEKLIEAGSLKTAKEKGWVRTEGKEYEMKDGDVVEFLVSN